MLWWCDTVGVDRLIHLCCCNFAWLLLESSVEILATVDRPLLGARMGTVSSARLAQVRTRSGLLGADVSPRVNAHARDDDTSLLVDERTSRPRALVGYGVLMMVLYGTGMIPLAGPDWGPLVP